MASYTNFFVGSTTVAGALAGLLFVALSVAPQRLMGATASTEQQAITARSAASAQSAAGTLVLVFFAVGIARSWELLGLRGGGLMDLLVAHAQTVIELPRAKSGDGAGPDA